MIDSATLVRLACLDYGGWRPADAGRAIQLLADDPAAGRGDIFAAAASGDVEATKAMRAETPALANSPGGPHGWAPLLYACYSRIPDTGSRSTLEVARHLLVNGADPNAGFLREENLPPFTALTGAFGEGEGGRTHPPHPRRDELVRLLLDHGADPNDGQTLYNRHFGENDDHLRTLFAYGLGADREGPWYRRYGARLASPARLLSEELWCAARRNYIERVRILLEHGVEVDARGLRNGRTACEEALLSGNTELAELLLRHGATKPELDPLESFAAACVAGRRDEARSWLEKDAGLLERLGEAGRIRLVHRAVEAKRPEGVRLMAELGFELDRWTEHDNAGINLHTTPLHNAAWMGNLEMAKLLLALGANPDARDPSYGATPLGWAEYNLQSDVAAFLRAKTQA